MNRMINSVVFCLLLLPALSYGERNLVLYTQDANGQKVVDPYTSRNTDINDSGRYMYVTGPGQNVVATDGASTSLAIAYTDMMTKTTVYVKSSQFNKLVEDEPNIDVSPDGRYLALRPSAGRAGLYSSEASPLYLFDIASEELTPVIKSFDGGPLQGCTHQWKLHNWSRSSFAYLQGELIYYSSCSNIVENDVNGASDLFAYNIASGENRLLTRTKNASGEWVQLNGSSVSPEVDDSGRFVVFSSQAKNMVDGTCSDTGFHVYVLDRLDGSYNRVTACGEAKASASNMYYGISGDGSTVLAGGGSIDVQPPAVTRLNVYSPESKSKYAMYSHFRRGAISLSYDASRVAFISNAFYNFAGTYMQDVSAHGSLEVWDRQTNTHVSISNHYYDQTAVNTFHHDDSAISGGGDFVYFSGNSSNFWIETIIGENSYHEFVGNRYVRNYRYVNLRGDHNQWTAFSNMRLIGDNLWQAEFITDVENSHFKIDVSSDWSENYGDNNGDGIGDFSGNNIVVAGGPGRYRVTFNDATKAYSMEPVYVPSLDTYLLPEGATTEFNCYNGHTQVGQSVYVVGSDDALGNWNVAHAIKLNPTAYPLWSGEILLPQGETIEWKCVKRNEHNAAEGIEWQAGGNNSTNSNWSAVTEGSF